jgi:hypothetical protein
MPPSTGSLAPRSRSGDARGDAALHVFALLLTLRIVNALTLRTFFQPDEFFQSLEPAWQLAFGSQSNAWITWVSLPPHLSLDTRLTMHAGMEDPVALVPASSPLRQCVSGGGKNR